MTTIIKKKIRGRYYYYAVESKRVNGKPRIVWQKYLGKVSDIVTAVSGLDRLPAPQSSRIYDFGAEAALLATGRRLGVEEIINRHVPRPGAGPGAGESLLLHSIHLFANPGVKPAQWFERTVLKRHFNFTARDFSTKRFSGLAELLTPETLENIQNDLARKIFEEFGLKPDALVYHCLKAPGCAGARPGKGSPLPLFFSLLATKEFRIPLFYATHRGGEANDGETGKIVRRLLEQYRNLGFDSKEVTLVNRDPGGKPLDSLYLPAEGMAPLRYIGELFPEECEDYLKVPLERFHPLRHGQREKIKVYRTAKKGEEKSSVILVVQHEDETAAHHEGTEAGVAGCRSLRRILSSDNIHWDNGEIYEAYFGRRELEDSLQRMAARSGALSAPKGERQAGAAAFCLVLALTLQGLLKRELQRCGVTGSNAELLKILSGMREVAVTYAIGESQLRKKEYVIMAELDHGQKKVFDCLKLQRFTAGGGCEEANRAGPACRDGGERERNFS
ncbi:MAG: hypothetical protein K6T80_01240 [Firmicutes bacterium]|nr:hypothetical protein [Bacillota bacterium]